LRVTSEPIWKRGSRPCWWIYNAFRAVNQTHKHRLVRSDGVRSGAMPYLCAVYGCGHNSTRESGLFRFYRIPSLIQNQGEQTLRLSKERRRTWLNNINRADSDLTEQKSKTTRVCSDHFITGKGFPYCFMGWLFLA